MFSVTAQTFPVCSENPFQRFVSVVFGGAVDGSLHFTTASRSNQIWSVGDGWLHFRGTTSLRDPGSARVTNGFLIIFHHPVLRLSVISPMTPETSCELHLNLSDQSRLRSSLNFTCLTATPPPSRRHHPVWWWQPKHQHLIQPANLLPAPSAFPHHKLRKVSELGTSPVAFMHKVLMQMVEAVSPKRLDELFLTAVVLTSGCWRIFQDITLADVT